MTNEYLITTESERVLEVQLNHDKTRNAISVELVQSLIKELHKAEASKTVRAVLITGNDKAFSSGGDIKSFIKPEVDKAAQVQTLLEDACNPLFLQMRNMKIPLVSAVNGTAIGGALGLAMSADIVYAARSVSFNVPYLNRLGAIPDAGSSWLLSRSLGPKRALALAMTGEDISAERAEQMGLIHRVVDDAELMNEARQCARQVADLPMKAFARAKYALYQAQVNSPEAHLTLETELQMLCFDGDEVNEAFAALSEGRSPVY